MYKPRLDEKNTIKTSILGSNQEDAIIANK
jgi:hypothetical protein